MRINVKLDGSELYITIEEVERAIRRYNEELEEAYKHYQEDIPYVESLKNYIERLTDLDRTLKEAYRNALGEYI